MSYLSKIEQGKVLPSQEILQLLLQRLGLTISDELLQQARSRAEAGYEALFSGNTEELHALDLSDESFLPTPAWMDLLLLRQADKMNGVPLESVLETCMDKRQLAMQRVLQGRCAEAIGLFPNAYFYHCAGCVAYETGDHYALALEYLQTGYELAAKEGMPYLMLQDQLLMGNCYCNQLDLENMEAHYRIAWRLAKALKRQKDLETIRYNTASAQVETGRYQDAYSYFSALENPGLLSLHKLAICCEKLGKIQEGLAALEKADALESDWPSTQLARKMCAVVRFRLKDRNYLEKASYGALLLECFETCRRELPIGYASFHLPWVIEWYTASRQYKKAYELIADFPIKLNLNQI